MSEIKHMNGAIPAREFEGQLWIEADVVIELRREDRSVIDRLTADCNDLRAILDALQVRHREVMAERDTAVADAERYQWLKVGGKLAVGYLELTPSSDTWDTAIDAAMKEQEQGK